MENFNLEDHKTALDAYRYIMTLPSARNNPALVVEIINEMQKHIKALEELNGRQSE